MTTVVLPLSAFLRLMSVFCFNSVKASCSLRDKLFFGFVIFIPPSRVHDKTRDLKPCKTPSSDSIYYMLDVSGCINEIRQVILSGKSETSLNRPHRVFCAINITSTKLLFVVSTFAVRW